MAEKPPFLQDNERNLGTIRVPWLTIGTIDSTAAAADSTLGVAERDFATTDALANAVTALVSPSMNALEVRFVLTTNDADVDIEIWACRGANEMKRIVTLDVICGQQDYTDTTHHFAQTINLSNEKWHSDITAISDDDDTMALLLITDTHGYDRFIFHGFGTFDEDCIVEVSGY